MKNVSICNSVFYQLFNIYRIDTIANREPLSFLVLKFMFKTCRSKARLDKQIVCGKEKTSFYSHFIKSRP